MSRRLGAGCSWRVTQAAGSCGREVGIEGPAGIVGGEGDESLDLDVGDGPEKAGPEQESQVVFSRQNKQDVEVDKIKEMGGGVVSLLQQILEVSGLVTGRVRLSQTGMLGGEANWRAVHGIWGQAPASMRGWVSAQLSGGGLYLPGYD